MQENQTITAKTIEKIELWKKEMFSNIAYFDNSKEYYDRATKKIQATNKNLLCEYGISYLDEKLLGIFDDELVIVGSWSGVGKSNMSDHIAVSNALKGKRVCYFRLEGDKTEFARLQLWKKTAEYYYASPYRERIENFDYHNFRANNLPGIDAYLLHAQEELEKLHENIFIFDKSHKLTKESFLDHLQKIIKSKIDLIIIDHLHYFDLWAGDNENKQIADIMRLIKESTEEYNIPIVLISHLRKKTDKRLIIPSQDDFMGTSNIAKEADTIVCIAPDYGNYDNQNNIYSTIFRVAKNRAGVRANSMALIDFNGIRKQYSASFKEGRVINFGEGYELY